MRIVALLCLLLASALAAPAAAEPLLVAVSIPPQKYFVQKLGGTLVEVLVLVDKGDAHTYEPKPRQMAALSRASVYFALGLEFERPWLPRFRAANPGLHIVYTDAGIEKLPVLLSMAGVELPAEPLPEHGHQTADTQHGHETATTDHGHAATTDHGHDAAAPPHGHGHDHAGGLDPHIWLSPALVKIQARTMAEALAEADPAHAVEYRYNLTAFLAEIDELDQQIRALLAPLPLQRRRFLVFHPSWGYFARDYGLTQLAIEAHGKEPSPGELGRVIEAARQAAVSTVFVQPQTSSRNAETIARQIGAEVVRLDPLAEDWTRNLLEAARAFQTALASDSGRL